MLSFTIDSRTGYLGLSPKVMFRLELGFAIVDDGEQLIRIQQQVFEELIQQIQSAAAAAPSPQQQALFERHPSLFELYDDAGSATASVLDKEI